MLNRRPYKGRFTIFSAWTLKAIALVIAGAATVMIALTVTRAVSIKSDSSPGGKFVGVRHDAASMQLAMRTPSDVPAPSSGPDQEPQSNTVVRNGLTVVSPQLRVPIIDIDSVQTTSGTGDDVSSNKTANQKRARNTNRSRSQHQHRVAAKRWKAYGLALR